MIKVATLFLARCKWYCLISFFIIVALATGCGIRLSYLRQPISERVITHEVPRGSVAILPPISWEPPTCYYSTGRKFLREYLKKHSKNYQLGPSYLMTTWGEAIEASKLEKKEFLELYSLWTSIRIKCGEVLLEHGVDIVPFREVDLAVLKIMPKFWNEDSRTSENVVLLCKEMKASHVVSIENFYTFNFITIRVEVYNQKGKSEFVGLASSLASLWRRGNLQNLQKAYANAIRIATSQWLGPSEYIIPSTCNSLETYEVIIDGFWAAEGYNGKNSFTIPPKSKVSLIAQTAIPTVTSGFGTIMQSKYAKCLLNKLEKLLEQQGYVVTQANLLNELLEKPKDIPFFSSYNRTTTKLTEIAKSSGARYIIFCEVRAEYEFMETFWPDKYAVVFLKIIDVETGNTWTQMLDEEKTKIPKVIIQQISTK